MARRDRVPRPSVTNPRPILLGGVLAFVRTASRIAGVRRISLIGSLATNKAIPKDADVLVTIDATMDLTELAHAGRRLKGSAQQINLGADIFLADERRIYLGRICGYRQCHVRVLCVAQHCGHRQHLNDDLHVVTLKPELIGAPPFDLWPTVIRRSVVPDDVEVLLLSQFEARPPAPA